MNLDIDHVIRIFFSLKYELLYRLGLDGISACFCSSALNQSPSVPYRYINKLPFSSLKFVRYAYYNLYRGTNGYISQGKRLSYSELQGIWSLVQNKGSSQK